MKGKGEGGKSKRGHCARVRKIPNVEAKVSMGFNYEANKKLQLHRLSCCRAAKRVESIENECEKGDGE